MNRVINKDRKVWNILINRKKREENTNKYQIGKGRRLERRALLSKENKEKKIEKTGELMPTKEVRKKKLLVWREIN